MIYTKKQNKKNKTDAVKLDCPKKKVRQQDHKKIKTKVVVSVCDIL